MNNKNILLDTYKRLVASGLIEITINYDGEPEPIYSDKAKELLARVVATSEVATDLMEDAICRMGRETFPGLVGAYLGSTQSISALSDFWAKTAQEFTAACFQYALDELLDREEIIFMLCQHPDYPALLREWERDNAELPDFQAEANSDRDHEQSTAARAAC